MLLAPVINIDAAQREVVVHARDLGLKGDGRTLCTTVLQRAIDRLAARRGGTLVVDSGMYLTGSLETQERHHLEA
jgi:polygalacturonase